MSILDVDVVYTNTGDILQLNYAQKAADSGSTCICLKNKKGIVIIAEKPLESKLFISEKSNRIKKVTDYIYQIASGIENDLVYINENLRNNILEEKYLNEMDISHESLRNQLVNIIHQFTRYSGVRPIGINILTASKYNNEYKILHTDCTGKSIFYNSAVIGKGSRIVKTELEKLNLENLEINELIDNGIRILYKSYDPLKDKHFDIEVGVMCEETNGRCVKLERHQLGLYIEKYKDYSIDGDE